MVSETTSTRSDRSGTVFWIIGLSGAGKTTVAATLSKKLREMSNPVVHFDGDQLRDILRARDAHDPRSRRELAFTYARLCSAVADQGIDTVCSTISLFPEVHQWNRDNNHSYIEIYLRVPMEVLAMRDNKGIYENSRKGEVNNVVGIDIPLVEPLAPDLTIDNDGRYEPDAVADLILAHIEKNKILEL